MIRCRPPTATAPSSLAHSQSASSPLSLSSGANVRSSRTPRLACQGRQSLGGCKPQKQPASLSRAPASDSSAAPITAPSGHQRRSNLVRLHLGPSALAPTAAAAAAPAAVTNARLRQGALYARRHQFPPAPHSAPPRHQLHHLPSCAGATGASSLASNQQSHIALTREISALAATSHKASVSRCLSKTKSCLQQSKELKKPTSKTTRLGALTIGSGVKTASKISLNSSTSSLRLAVVKRVRQASAASSSAAGSQRRHRQQPKSPSPSAGSSGYQSRASTSASRSNSSSGDVQTDAAPSAAASDDNSAAVERAATAIEPATNGQSQSQSQKQNNNTSAGPNIVAAKPKSDPNHHRAQGVAGQEAIDKQVAPVASPPAAQRNVEVDEDEEEEEDFQLDYYHHKTMIISSSPSELDYGDSEEEGQAVKPPPQQPPPTPAALKQPPPEIPIRTDLIGDHYDLEARPFARGKFAQVKRCVHKKSKQCFAAKCIKKRRRLADTRNEILLEISALKLSYYTERIVKLYEVYETPSEIIFVLEMARGGELQRVIDDEEVIDEHLVRRMVKQILEGLIQLHDNDIAHLDIKPQNLLLTEPFPNGDILLCDFGISRRITKDCEIRDICGTPDYVAPEILSYDPISLATDMWSLGVLTYVLLSGYSPFGSDNKQQTFCNITQAVLDFPSEIFDKISKEAIDFMQKLILREPTERLTSRQARQHPWLTGGTSNC